MNQMAGIQKIKAALQKYADKEKAKILRKFFKTGPGEYGEGDIFLGVVVPHIRKVAKTYYKTADIGDIRELLKSPIHEQRLLALIIFVLKFNQGAPGEQKRVYQIYMRHTAYINNWDLIDLTAPHIVGKYLYDKSRMPLYDLAQSKNFWERRIAVLAAFYFIRQNQFEDILKIAGMLRKDREDLIQKAVGWMLREVGKRDLAQEEKFLKQYCLDMPRTMLRYAIERFPEAKRQVYLKKRLSEPESR